VATLVFGVAAVFWPGLTLLTLLYLFSAYVLVSGIVNILAGLAIMEAVEAWFLTVALGAFELGVGVYMLRHPHVAFKTFVLLIGFVLIARGIIEVVDAFYSARASARAKTMTYVSGLAALVVGIVVLFAKASQGVTFVWLLGLYAIVVGTMHIAALSGGARK
jgi:uncharacterized membrane protein HdeD (DUF308 family)